jgi:hypothetical protein
MHFLRLHNRATLSQMLEVILVYHVFVLINFGFFYPLKNLDAIDMGQIFHRSALGSSHNYCGYDA